MSKETKTNQLETFKKIESLVLEVREMAVGSFDYHTQGRVIDPLVLEAEKIKRLEQIKELTKSIE